MIYLVTLWIVFFSDPFLKKAWFFGKRSFLAKDVPGTNIIIHPDWRLLAGLFHPVLPDAFRPVLLAWPARVPGKWGFGMSWTWVWRYRTCDPGQQICLLMLFWPIAGQHSHFLRHSCDILARCCGEYIQVDLRNHLNPGCRGMPNSVPCVSWVHPVAMCRVRGRICRHQVPLMKSPLSNSNRCSIRCSRWLFLT